MLSKSGGKIKNGQNLLGLLWKCCFAFLANPEGKKNTVWFYGAPNTGKSTIGGYFQEIFDQTTIILKGGWTHEGNFEMTRKKYSPNMVFIDEASVEYLFSGS